jgi:hypothetical protein
MHCFVLGLGATAHDAFVCVDPGISIMCSVCPSVGRCDLMVNALTGGLAAPLASPVL